MGFEMCFWAFFVKVSVVLVGFQGQRLFDEVKGILEYKKG